NNTLATSFIIAGSDLTPDGKTEIMAPGILTRMGFNKIQLEVNSSILSTEAKLEVKIFQNLPLYDDKGKYLVVLAAQSNPIKIFQVSPADKLKDKIKGAKIFFTLTRSELVSVEPVNIYLMRFTDQWDALETSVSKRNDDGSILFESATPGFSVFFVTAKNSSEKIPEVSEPPAEAASQQQPQKLSGQPSPITGLLEGSESSVVVLVIILVIGGIFVIVKRRSS
ncbi:MAG TPA: PGF-pre-PGF domain-containing protein, partial [archaeon]|nr:PGF-pre-PGF domain-containing protein [archaeon]